MIVVCRLDDVPDGGAIGALPNARGRDTLVLLRRGDQVLGYVNNCPHYDRAPLGWRKDEFLNGDGTRIMCAAHGALFRIEDGVCEVGPCLGQALTAVALTIRDGHVCLADGSALLS
ncbi:MAG: Rieske 2Fe-2S domain-containing protein [Tabrizicola sp.]|nr:Rieske 2Fe-2S domain-containing protein [Tabrizicola sp.]